MGSTSTPNGSLVLPLVRQAPPRIKRQKNYRGTPEREALIRATIAEVEKRQRHQAPESVPTDEELEAVWARFPDGIALVMRAADTAQSAFCFRGGAPYKLTWHDLLHLLVRGGGKCEVSGVPFSGEVIDGCIRRPFIPSIDRIEARKPYEIDNCRLVCWAVNKALGEWGDDVFWRIIRSAAER